MAEALPSSTFRDLAGEMDDALVTLERYGLSYEPGRFAQARRDLNELARMHDAGLLVSASRERTSRRLLTSLFDINEISHIFRSLLFLEGHGMGDDVHDFMARPGDSIMADQPDGVDGRDLAFELSMLSRFVAAGFKVHIERNADLRVSVGDSTLFVRCLGLRTPTQIGTRIRDSWRSLEFLSRGTKNSRSVLALSVSKLQGLEFDVLLAPDETRLKHLLRQPVTTFLNQHMHAWRHNPTDAMAGAFVFFARPVMISLTNRLIYSQELSFSTCHGDADPAPEVLDILLDRFDFLNALTSFS